jgi:hypothetical protein
MTNDSLIKAALEGLTDVAELAATALSAEEEALAIEAGFTPKEITDELADWKTRH